MILKKKILEIFKVKMKAFKKIKNTNQRKTNLKLLKTFQQKPRKIVKKAKAN